MILLVASLSVPGASFAVLSIMVAVAGTAAIVLTIRAIFPTVFSTIFAAVFSAVLSAVFAPVLAAIFTARGLIGLASHCGGREQGAGDEQCCPQL